MARIVASGEFSPVMPKPIGTFGYSVGPSSANVTYAGYSITMAGDFATKPGPTPWQMGEPYGTAYTIWLNGPSGWFSAEGVQIELGTVISAMKSLDLTSLANSILSGGDTVGGTSSVRIGGAGDDLLEWTESGVIFGGPGQDTYKALFDEKTHVVTQTAMGTVIRTTFSQAEVLLVGVEQIRFTDKTVTIDSSSPFYDFIAGSRQAVLRQPTDVFALQRDGKAGSKEAVVSRLVEEARDSTAPALIVFDAIMGKAPSTSAQLDSLAAFVKGQIGSIGYQATSNPRLGGYEAMGLGLSDAIEFKAKFGAGSDADMVKSGYLQFFGRAATDAQVSHFTGQIDYFKNLYTSVGIDAASASVKARGAAAGQMLGYAADEGGVVKAEANNWLTAAAYGSAKYGQPLDMI